MSAAALLVYSSCVLIPRRHVHDECEERLGRTRCFRSCDPTAKFWLSGLKRHLSREYAQDADNASGVIAVLIEWSRHPGKRHSNLLSPIPTRRTMTAETIAKALGGRKAGGGWMARCPAHDDRTPSLSIRDADDGKVLVRCHAGCDQERVIAALRSRGLWTENGSRRFTRSAPRAAAKTQAGSRRRQAQRGRARHLAVRDAGTGNAGRDLSRLARPRTCRRPPRCASMPA